VNSSFGLARQLIKKPNVRNILIAYLTTYLGTAMAPIAMAFGVLELTGSTKSMSLVIAAATVSTILVLFVSGAVADRTSRQKVIVISETAAMIIQVTIAALFFMGLAQIPLLMVLMFLNGMAIGFNAPATMGLIPQLVEKEELQTINSILGIARNSALIGGAALGGLLVSLIGAGATIAIDAVSFGISAILMAQLKPAAQAKIKEDSIFKQLKLGWVEFKSHTWLWAIVVQFSFVLAAFEAAIHILGPAVSTDFYSGAKSWGLIMAGLSAGLFVGGIFGIRYRPEHPLRVATICVFSAALIPLALSGPFPVYIVILAAFVNGFCWELFGIFWVSTLQQKIAPELLSRVSAYDYIGSIGLAPLGIVLVGYFYESAGFRMVGLLSALLIVAATAIVLMVKDVWYLKTSTDVASD
jgi:MFS family permease